VTNQPTNQTNELTKKPTKPTNQWTDKVTNHPPNQPKTNQPMNQSSDQPTNQPNQGTNQKTNHPPSHLSDYKEQHPFCRPPSSSTPSHITFMLQNPTIHYDTDHSPPTVPVLSHTNPVHAVPAYTFQSIFSIFLISVHRYSERSLSSASSYQKPTGTFFSPMWRILCLSLK